MTYKITINPTDMLCDDDSVLFCMIATRDISSETITEQFFHKDHIHSALDIVMYDIERFMKKLCK